MPGGDPPPGPPDHPGAFSSHQYENVNDLLHAIQSLDSTKAKWVAVLVTYSEIPNEHHI